MISMQTYMTILFVLISETLMFHCCFVDDSLMNIRRDIFEALLFSLEAFLIFIVFVVLTCDSFMFHCFFLKDSLMTLWRNIDETPKTWMQTLKIIEVLNVMIIRTLIPLLLHWLIVDDPVKNLWWDFDDLDANIYDNSFCANLRNIDVSLPFRRWIVDEYLERHLWSIVIFIGSFFDLHRFCCVNLWFIHVSLLLPWRFVDDSLKNHWWNSKDLDANSKDLWSFKCDNHQNVDSFAARLINRWWSCEESLIRFWWFGCKHWWQKFICANLQNIDVSLLLRRWFVDDFWRDVIETLIISMETLLIFVVFVV